MKLTEVVTTDDPIAAAEYIASHCQPYLKAIQYQATTHRLYRGLSTSKLNRIPFNGADIYSMPGRNPGRVPVDSPQVIHDAANQVFKEQFGIPYRDGVFVVGAISVAYGYGDMLGIILPVGEFKFLWSPKVRDLYQFYINSRTEALEHTPVDRVWQRMAEYPKRFINKLPSLQYQDTDLVSAINSRHEIMLYCDNCLMLRTDVDSIKAKAILQAIQDKGTQ